MWARRILIALLIMGAMGAKPWWADLLPTIRVSYRLMANQRVPRNQQEMDTWLAELQPTSIPDIQADFNTVDILETRVRQRFLVTLSWDMPEEVLAEDSRTNFDEQF